MMSAGIDLSEYDVLVDVASGGARGIPPCPPDFFGYPVRPDLTVPAEVFVDSLHPDDLDRMLAVAEELQAIRPDGEHQYELRLRHASGPYVLVRVTSRPCEVSANGTVLSVVSHIQPLAVLP